MGRTLSQVMAELPPERRKRIEAAAAAEIESLTLAEIRQAVEATQSELAERLDISQSKISEMERRQDHRLSTLRRYVEAAGGRLDLIITLPGREPVRLAMEEGPPRP